MMCAPLLAGNNSIYAVTQDVMQRFLQVSLEPQPSNKSVAIVAYTNVRFA